MKHCKRVPNSIKVTWPRHLFWKFSGNTVKICSEYQYPTPNITCPSFAL